MHRNTLHTNTNIQVFKNKVEEYKSGWIGFDLEIAEDVHGHLASKQAGGEGGHFVHFCKIYNLQVTELPRESYLSASFYLRIFTILFQCLFHPKVGEGKKDDLLRKFWRQRGKFLRWIANVSTFKLAANICHSTFFSKLISRKLSEVKRGSEIGIDLIATVWSSGTVKK